MKNDFTVIQTDEMTELKKEMQRMQDLINKLEAENKMLKAQLTKAISKAT